MHVTGAKRGAKLTLVARSGKRASQRAGKLGGAVFRNVKPGRYRVNAQRVRVLSDRSAPPSTKRYRQRIPKSGYGYLTTRDGTKLAINVHLPSGPGPYPTLVEYSGYGYANPDGAESGIAPIANLLGYAVVDVNMRGTGCSGGAFDFFETLQSLDGYDVIETVARAAVGRARQGRDDRRVLRRDQPAVRRRRRGRRACRRSRRCRCIDNTQTTLYPGGILNTGFALEWAKDRADDAKPASKTGGQPWALKRIRDGDKTCKANQALHAEAIDVIAKVRANDHYVPKVADPLAPDRFVQQDQRAGLPRLPVHRRADRRALPVAAAALHRHEAQVVHVHQRRRTPTRSTPPPSCAGTTSSSSTSRTAARSCPQSVRDVAPIILKTLMGVEGVGLPDGDPIQAQPSYEAALAAFEAQPSVRILFDNGAGSTPLLRPSPASSARSPASRCRARRRARGTSRRAAHWPT